MDARNDDVRPETYQIENVQDTTMEGHYKIVSELIEQISSGDL
jgi:hypothetical protein